MMLFIKWAALGHNISVFGLNNGGHTLNKVHIVNYVIRMPKSLCLSPLTLISNYRHLHICGLSHEFQNNYSFLASFKVFI